MRYTYLGKREIYKRAQAQTGGTLPPAANFYYSKFEGVERLESDGYKSTSQRGGDWLQITVHRYYPDYEDTIRTCDTFTGYSEDGYRNRY